MRLPILTAATLLPLLVATASPAGQAQRLPTPQPRVPASSTAVLPGTQALLDGYVRDGKMSGIVGGFGAYDLPTLYVASGRIGDAATSQAANADTLWRVYSMTKPITAMAAMILIEDGKLQLDEPVSDVLPAFKAMRVLTDPEHSLASRPAVRPITIRNLLTHTAGLGYNIVTTGPLKAEYERQGILPGAVNVSVEAEARKTRPANLQAFANKVATLPLIADPGTKWSYSIGLDVLAAVVEKASGMPFERFVQTRLFGPLRMTSSFWQVPASEVGRLADNDAFVGETRVPFDPAATSVFLQPPSFPYGGAGLVMSARDYDRFLHMLQDEGTLDGVRVMKPETVRLAMSNLLPAGVTFGGVGGGTGGSTGAAVPMGFGAGGSVYLADTPGGAGKGTYGWGGAAGTVAWVDPVRHARGVIMVNYFPADKWPLRQQIIPALLRDMARFSR